jgi:two-component sensor histidine kinase
MLDLQRLVRALPQQPLSLSRDAALAVACVAAGTAFHWLLEPALRGVPFITAFPAVLVASVLGGIRAGAMALLLSAAVAEYLWLAPYGSIDLSNSGWVALLVYLAMGSIVVLAAHLLQVAVAMARESEARSGLIAREMQHRIGNKLALVQAVARLSARHARTLDEFQELFSARLRALSESQNVVGPDPDLPTDLGSLLKVVLRPFDEQRIGLSGPAVGIEHRDRPMLALLVHELGTNAVKHGSLSAPGGRVLVGWSMAEPGALIEWNEIGGPPVTPPSETGFGTSLANAAFPPDRGEVSLDYRPDGLRCTIRLLAARSFVASPDARGSVLPAAQVTPLGS